MNKEQRQSLFNYLSDNHDVLLSEGELDEIGIILEKHERMYRHKWIYNDSERPYGCCYDCRMKYSEFPDMTISDEYWEKINPTEHKGAGLLCPTCIINRLNYLGLWYK